ncbi:nucleoside hydrolase [Lacipirellula sp.]|uniref:nucleoside hydrolase n=1 Tax=Lacipirellula sp. TaxID=2691419 RepID=UPI003D100EE9
MPRKVILDVDPGVSDALAVCLAIAHPDLEVVAVTATGGNVAPRQASRNVQAIIEHLDPPRWPRIGVADEEQPLRTDGRELWGADGFCGATLGIAELHQQHPALKVIAEEIRNDPGGVTIIAGGPLHNIAAAFQLDPELALQVGHLIIVGGTLEGPGDVTAAAEFNMYCDAESAQRVFRSHATTTLLPLDVTSRAALTYELLSNLPSEGSSLGRLLRTLLPGAFQSYRQRLGLESMYAAEAVAVMSILRPELLVTEAMPVDVETEGMITYGATVIDRRPRTLDRPNMDVAVEIDAPAIVEGIMRGLRAGF